MYYLSLADGRPPRAIQLGPLDPELLAVGVHVDPVEHPLLHVDAEADRAGQVAGDDNRAFLVLGVHALDAGPGAVEVGPVKEA